MIASIAHLASYGAAAVARALAWLERAGAARRTMAQLARMSDVELRDIGLVRQDVVDSSAIRAETDPSVLAVRHVAPRRANQAA